MAVGTLDTFPKLLMHHAQVRGARPAIREKDLGIWQTWTWKRFADEVRTLAGGLHAVHHEADAAFAADAPERRQVDAIAVTVGHVGGGHNAGARVHRIEKRRERKPAVAVPGQTDLDTLSFPMLPNPDVRQMLQVR